MFMFYGAEQKPWRAQLCIPSCFVFVWTCSIGQMAQFNPQIALHGSQFTLNSLKSFIRWGYSYFNFAETLIWFVQE